jgi:hypothetical protein
MGSAHRPAVLNAVHARAGRQWLAGSSHRFLRGPASEDNLLYKNNVRAPVINESQICEDPESRYTVKYDQVGILQGC